MIHCVLKLTCASAFQLFVHAGVIDVLTEALKDKNERVRRRIMATLGELLFYVATQQQVQTERHISSFFF